MEQNPYWEAGRFSASQEITHILWNPKVHYRITSANQSIIPGPRCVFMFRNYASF